VSPQLVRATDQTAIWAEPFEGPLSDVFAFQSRVAERVAQALDVALRPPDQQRLIRRPTNNLDAYDAYLRGLASSTRAKVFQAPARREAVKEFERAVQLDPAFTAAHARLAIALTNRVFHDGDVALSVVRPSVDRAMALDSTLLETRLARATYLQLVDAQAALSVATQAVADQPNSVELLVQLGLAQWSVFREAEAAKTLERAAELDPRSPDPLAYLAGLFDQLGRYEEAMRWREREITLTPDNPAAYVSQASADMLWRVDTASARRQLERGIAAAGLKAMTLRRGRAVMGALKKRTLPRELVICNDTVSLSGSGMPPLLFHVEKAIYLANAGQIDRARVHAASAVALTPMTSDDPQVHANLAMMFAILGRASDEAGAAARAVELSDGTAASRRIIGMPYATVAAADMIVGRKDAALQRLEKALSYRSGFIISPALLRADPLWAPLRGNPRFERLINVR
jgi:tetratricopeptide (TPR) repeat protein